MATVSTVGRFSKLSPSFASFFLRFFFKALFSKRPFRTCLCRMRAEHIKYWVLRMGVPASLVDLQIVQLKIHIYGSHQNIHTLISTQCQLWRFVDMLVLPSWRLVRWKGIWEECYIVTYADSHLHTCTYICRIIHSDTTIKTHAERRTNKGRRNKGRMKTSLQIYLPLTLLQGFERVFQSLHVRGCWRPNINFIFWPHCYDRHVVSFLFSWCWGLLHRGFPRAPSVGCGLPYHIWSLAVWNSASNCFGTQLNSII